MRIRWFPFGISFCWVQSDHWPREARIVRRLHVDHCFLYHYISRYFHITSGTHRIVLVYIYCKIEDSRQRPSAVTFLKLFEGRQRGFDDVTLVSLTQIRCSEEFTVSSIDAFISTFVTYHKFIVEHSVHLYTVVSFYNVPHSFEHYTTGFLFQKLSRFDVIVTYWQLIYDRIENGWLIST